MWVMVFLIPSEMLSYLEELKPTKEVSDSGDLACTLPALFIYLPAAEGAHSRLLLVKAFLTSQSQGDSGRLGSQLPTRGAARGS